MTYFQSAPLNIIEQFNNVKLPAADVGQAMMMDGNLTSLNKAGVVGDILGEITSTFFGDPAGAIGAGSEILLNMGVQIAAPFFALAILIKGLKMAYGIK